MDFEVCEREPHKRISAGPRLSAISVALMETATSGKALRVPQNGRKFHAVTSNGRSLAARRGLVFHSYTDGDTVVMWMERR